jgi:hypothetical protein
MGKPLPNPAVQPGPVPAGSRPLPLVPRSMEEAMALARAVVASRMAPRGMETPEACMIAIMHGLEVGLTPLMALQRIALVEGRPTIWGDGAMALVRASGLCRSVKEWVEGESTETWVASCEVHRRGETDPVVRQFGVEDAKRAGLWGRPGPWSNYPRRMLQMRARAFALRDVFADVLGGLYLREEIEDGADLSPVENAETSGSGEAGQEKVSPATTPTSSARRPIRAAAKTSPRGRAASRRSSTWVRLRPPRESIRLRAPSPPEYTQAGSEGTSQPEVRSDPPSSRSEDVAVRESDVPWAAAPDETLSLLDDALACACDAATLTEIEEEFASRLKELPRHAVNEAARIRDRHRQRIASLSEGGLP